MSASSSLASYVRLAFIFAGSVAAFGGAAQASVLITFGAPDNLEVGAAPLPAVSTFGLSWDFDASGTQRLNLLTSVQAPYQLLNSIVPSPNGHAINTKGAGGERMMGLGFTPANPVLPVMALKTRTKSNNTNERTVEVTGTLGDATTNPLFNNVFVLDIDISSPAGMVFSSDPTVEIAPDFSMITINTHLVLPSGGAIDPNLPDARFALSAIAQPVPEPASLALITLGGAALLLRRRR